MSKTERSLLGIIIICCFYFSSVASSSEAIYHTSDTMLSTVMSSYPGGIGIVKDGVIVWVNDYILAMLGYSSDEIIGQNAGMLHLTDEEFDYVEKEKYRQIPVNDSAAAESQWVTRDGELRAVKVSSFPLGGGDYSAGFLFTVADISSEKNNALNLHSPATLLFFAAILFIVALSVALLFLAAMVRKMKAVQRSLRESEEQLSATLYSIGDGVICCDNQGLVRSLNPVAEKLTGWTTSDAQGNHVDQVFNIVNALNREKAINPVGRSLEWGVIVGLANHTILIDRKGKECQIADSCAPIRSAAGEILGAVLVFRDVTREYSMQERIKSSEALLSDVFNSIQDGICVSDKNLNILRVNRVLEEWYAQSMPLTGNKCYRCFHNADKPCSPCPALRTLSTGNTEWNVIRGPSGTAVEWIELYSYPIRDSQSGEIVGVVEFVRNITEKRKAEDTVRALKETVENATDGIAISTPQGQLYYYNKSFELVFGERTSSSESLFVDTTLEKEIFDLLVAGKSWTGETKMYGKKGRILDVFLRAYSNKDENDAVISLVGIYTDVTETKKAEKSLANMLKLESLGIMAGGIAHDFNNLLGAIFGYIDVAAFETNEESTAKNLGTALHTIDRARNLTQQLLTFAKGGDPIKKTQPLCPFIEQTVTFAISGSNSSCRFDLPKDLWPCSIDKNQIAQVLDNIVINALQAMSDGGSVEITGENMVFSENQHPTIRSGKYVKLSIKDSGIGMPKDILGRICDPFFTTKEKGHGLGLSTSYSIIKRHDGYIDVESRQGKGSTFYLYLPAVTETLPPRDASADAQKKHKGSGIFVVMDDEKVVREVIGKMLEIFGYEAVLKENGTDAVEFFRKEKNRIRGMLFDLTIPGNMGGKEAILEIRNIGSNVPVFVSSGYAADPVMADPEKYGFTASIRKPFMIAQFTELLNQYMDK